MNVSKLPTMLLLSLSFASASMRHEGYLRQKQRRALEQRLEQLGSMGKSLLQALHKVSAMAFWGAVSMVGLSLLASAGLAMKWPGGAQALPLVLLVSGVGSTLISFFVFGRREDAHQAHVQGLIDSMVRVPR